MDVKHKRILARVKPGIFGQTAKFGQRPCLFHISNIGIKNKIYLANSENPDETAHKEPSHLGLNCLKICAGIYLMSEITRHYPTVFFQGEATMSDYAISFHYISPTSMHTIDFLIYQLQPYGISYGPQDLNQNISLTSRNLNQNYSATR